MRRATAAAGAAVATTATKCYSTAVGPSPPLYQHTTRRDAIAAIAAAARERRRATALVCSSSRSFTSIPIRHTGTAAAGDPLERRGRRNASGGDKRALDENTAGRPMRARAQTEAEGKAAGPFAVDAGDLPFYITEDWHAGHDTAHHPLSSSSSSGGGGGAWLSPGPRVPFCTSYDLAGADAPPTGGKGSSSGHWSPEEASRSSLASVPPSEEIRVPRILFFGGDIVSLTALEALYERYECVARHAFAMQEAELDGDDAEDREDGGGSSSSGGVGGGGELWDDLSPSSSTVGCHDPRQQRRLALLRRLRRRLRRSRYTQRSALDPSSPEARRVRDFVRDHLTVVCPYLPNNITPAEAARRYSRQYPVARFAVEKGLHVVPVDHPKSLKKSRLLQDMVGDRGTGGTGLQHARQQRLQRQEEERTRRRLLETRWGRCRARLARWLGVATAAAAPLLAGPTYYFSSAPLLLSSASAAATTTTTTTTTPGTAAAPLAEGISTPWIRHGRPLRDFDLAVIVSFRYFVPPSLLEALPPVINMHPSLLPLYRGASPIFSTLMRNEPVGGASIIQLRADQKMMDSGNILWQCEVPVARDVDIRTYMPLVTQLGAAGLCDIVFGEHHGRNPIWCQRHAQHSSLTAAARAAVAGAADSAASTSNSSSSPAAASTAVAKSSPGLLAEEAVPPPLITAEVIHAALQTQRSYVRYCEHCAATGTIPSSPSASLRETKCSENFPRSVKNGYCDWPDTFWFHWRTAAEQRYGVFSHFSEDPFHAPLLPRDAAVLRFSCFTDAQAFGVWRAFVGGQYFQPSVNATLDKGCTPVRNQLSKRTLRRLVREKMKRIGKQKGKRAPPAAAAGGANGGATAEEAAAAGAAAKKKQQQQQQQQQRQRPEQKKTGTAPAAGSPSAQKAKANGSGGGGGGGGGGRGEKNARPQQKQQRRRTQKASAPIDLEAVAAIIDTGMLQQVEEDLRLTCTFTKAIHPDLVPAPVLEEMARVERGLAPSPSMPRHRPNDPHQQQHCSGGSVRFFRQPRPIFNCTDLTQKVQAARAERRRRRAEQLRESCASPVMRKATGAEWASRWDAAPAPTTTASSSSGVDADEDDDEEERKESGLVLLKTPELRMALSADDDDADGDGGRGGASREAADAEEAPEGYVPDVIHAAPPSPLPWLPAEVGEEAGLDYADSERGAESVGDSVCSPGGDGEGPRHSEAPIRATIAAAGAPHAAVLPSAPPLANPHSSTDDKNNTGSSRQGRPQQPRRRSVTPVFHIPTGTAYFPVCDESIGAIKCMDGWFFWREAHLKYATRAQPVVLLRKGMAMKTGVLYAGLFSEYCK